ncbi:DNA-binding response regulator [Paractinoplanes abujensis]|uniref:DNA-binding NarL/FixJ family response regulator n=1 Tax=Paractinoplanes abujensis TaxID=882441 RepID=A0A7W7G0C3_9ACTN|nr:response regulator transcription factor [Actinoplanes abujensis]MBB4692963.1 DNA-binding NarL/FixJ family response regulator [Actinoplanes abujensis]GID22534.1 DNA-binding response regulator [Actinoplanes abujensis]
MSLRVFIADDQRLVRDGLRMMLESCDDLVVVGEAGDGRAAVDALRGLGADVVLMDVRMPVMDGVEATRALSELGHPARVLILTTFDLDEYAFTALRAGAAGFLLKDARQAELQNAVREVAAGGAVVAPSTTRRLLPYLIDRLPGGRAGPDARLGTLTPRETEVLTEIAAGATNAEIATRLHMAEATVKTHIGNLFAKLHCRDRVALVLFAFDAGLRPGSQARGPSSPP